MGEKCELPRFSGLILYDERGTPVRNSGIGTTDHQGRINAYTVHNSRIGTTDHQVRINAYTVLLSIFACCEWANIIQHSHEYRINVR